MTLDEAGRGLVRGISSVEVGHACQKLCKVGWGWLRLGDVGSASTRLCVIG